ncbi:MAG TPA: hypothetical protein VKE41_25330 [Roseiflexaceae bacterium]|nr:hypothetical protein [Roseiflexaceae bacterium]
MKKRHTPQRTETPATTDQPASPSTPITPAEALRQTCPCCGAILPLPLSRLDAIPGQEHLRRAVTVALTGTHPITFLGSGAALADALAFGRIARGYGLTAYVTTSCICGNAGDPYLVCRCTPKAIFDWRRRPSFQAALRADIVVEVAHTSAEQRIAHRRSESDEQLIARAADGLPGAPRSSHTAGNHISTRRVCLRLEPRHGDRPTQSAAPVQGCLGASEAACDNPVP